MRIGWRRACNGNGMLRITKSETEQVVSIELEGKLAGAWVAELEHIYTAAKIQLQGREIVVDMKNLTGTDTAGRYLLLVMQREGVAMENPGFYYPMLLGPDRAGESWREAKG